MFVFEFFTHPSSYTGQWGIFVNILTFGPFVFVFEFFTHPSSYTGQYSGVKLGITKVLRNSTIRLLVFCQHLLAEEYFAD